MPSPDAHPILVTGAHRTGTTWVGRLLAAAHDVAYISEPLNVLHRPGVMRVKVPKWYTYICSENGDAYYAGFRALLAYRYHAFDELKSLRSLHDVGRMIRDITVFLGAWVGRRRPLIKDPFAVFSLRWFVETFGCKVVVTIRHPAAFVSGLKRLGWHFDFADLLEQPLLMRDFLESSRAAMAACSPEDIVGQGGMLWSMIYGVVREQMAGNPGIMLVRHEDMARDPVNRFHELYRQLGLEFTNRVERMIVASTGEGNPVELARGRTHAIKMNSRASLENWRHRLTNEEILRVRKLTEAVATSYYPEESWS